MPYPNPHLPSFTPATTESQADDLDMVATAAGWCVREIENATEALDVAIRNADDPIGKARLKRARQILAAAFDDSAIAELATQAREAADAFEHETPSAEVEALADRRWQHARVL